jgi:hypothetical protein
MKKYIFLIFCVFAECIMGSSQQEIKLSDINKPGETGIAERQGIILAENIFGPHKVVFSGNAPGSPLPVLSKEVQGKLGGKGSFNKLAVLFSGKLFSPNMAEPIIFNNKTPEELILLEFLILPIILEQPYALFLDLSIKASSKPIGVAVSDDAGIYQAVLNVILINI